jgi:hypothetical protein
MEAASSLQDQPVPKNKKTDLSFLDQADFRALYSGNSLFFVCSSFRKASSIQPAGLRSQG